jgi:hypothetical protein|tara:strand:+ start:1857 stop:2483 length:627 start_codon:yes stop_codon:yes gene_type:complete
MQILLLSKNLLYFLTILLFFQISYSNNAAEITLLNQKEISINDSIEFEDPDILLELLKANPEVERIVFVNSHSGYPLIGFDFSDIIIDFELDTHILEACSGECIAAFLGGNKRTLERGAKIYFKYLGYTAEAIRGHSKTEWFKSDYEDFADYAEYIYKEGRSEIVDYFSLMTERGVKPEFAIETLVNGLEDWWTPRRSVLIKSNYLTE